VREYLDTLDDAAFGAASPVGPKLTSHSDPASQWIAARKGKTFFSYSDGFLNDTDHGVIVDVEATRSIRQAEVGSTKTMQRVKARFDLHPERLIADTAYGAGPMLGWLVDRKIAPHIPVFHCPAGDCEAICRKGQVWPQRWHLEPGGLRVGRGEQSVHLPGRPRAEAVPAELLRSEPRGHWQWRRKIPRPEAHLPGLPLEVALPSEHGLRVHHSRGT
jgi:hypothetical protein